MYEQTELFPKEKTAAPMPSSTSWNLWHGCHKCSPGCRHCYVYRRDAEFGRDSSIVRKTKAFRKPVQKYRTGPHKGEYKYPSGSVFLTCFTSDFFIEEADEWRPEAWEIMRERSDCTFYMITKRPERILQSLPADWGAVIQMSRSAVPARIREWQISACPSFWSCRCQTNPSFMNLCWRRSTSGPIWKNSALRSTAFPVAESPDRTPGSATTAGFLIPICNALNMAFHSVSIRQEPDSGEERKSMRFPESISTSRRIRHIWIITV